MWRRSPHFRRRLKLHFCRRLYRNQIRRSRFSQKYMQMWWKYRGTARKCLPVQNRYLPNSEWTRMCFRLPQRHKANWGRQVLQVYRRYSTEPWQEDLYRQHHVPRNRLPWSREVNLHLHWWRGAKWRGRLFLWRQIRERGHEWLRCRMPSQFCGPRWHLWVQPRLWNRRWFLC